MFDTPTSTHPLPILTCIDRLQFNVKNVKNFTNVKSVTRILNSCQTKNLKNNKISKNLKSKSAQNVILNTCQTRKTHKKTKCMENMQDMIKTQYTKNFHNQISKKCKKPKDKKKN